MQTRYRHSPYIGLVDLVCNKMLPIGIVTKGRLGCLDKHFIVEKGIDQNDFQCRYRLSLGLELDLDLDVEINRSNAGPDLCNTHTHTHTHT